MKRINLRVGVFKCLLRRLILSDCLQLFRPIKPQADCISLTNTSNLKSYHINGIPDYKSPTSLPLWTPPYPFDCRGRRRTHPCWEPEERFWCFPHFWANVLRDCESDLKALATVFADFEPGFQRWDFHYPFRVSPAPIIFRIFTQKVRI